MKISAHDLAGKMDDTASFLVLDHCCGGHPITKNPPNFGRRWSFGAAFAAVRGDGRVVSWGLPHAGGDSSSLDGNLTMARKKIKNWHLSHMHIL